MQTFALSWRPLITYSVLLCFGFYLEMNLTLVDLNDFLLSLMELTLARRCVYHSIGFLSVGLSQSFFFSVSLIQFLSVNLLLSPSPPLSLSEKCTDAQSEGLTKDKCRDDRVCGFYLFFDSFL